MLKYLGFSPSVDDVLDFIDETDLDQDGRVSLREFQRFLRVSHRKLPTGTADHMLVPVTKTEASKLKDAFTEARQRRKVQHELTAAVIATALSASSLSRPRRRSCRAGIPTQALQRTMCCTAFW